MRASLGYTDLAGIELLSPGRRHFMRRYSIRSSQVSSMLRMRLPCAISSRSTFAHCCRWTVYSSWLACRMMGFTRL